MKTYFQLLQSRTVLFGLACLFVIALTSAHPSTSPAMQTTVTSLKCTVDVDGTQLAQQAKDLLSETYHVPVSQVTAVYCCQLIDGRFKYNCTIPIYNDGFVYFTISGGQIIEEDAEGF